MLVFQEVSQAALLLRQVWEVFQKEGPESLRLAIVFIHLFTKYFFGTQCVPGSGLDAGMGPDNEGAYSLAKHVQETSREAREVAGTTLCEALQT